MEENIPAQREGGFSDTVSDKQFPSQEAAQNFFKILKKRFLDVSSWELWAGEEKADFTLTDPAGNPMKTAPQKGDCFKIRIPGPENPTGNAFDWVRIEEIINEKHADKESITIRVRPCPNPTNPSEETAHFFADDATSTFIIRREGTTVYAEVHGRNEKPNTEHLGIVEKIRNTLVAIGGILGGSKFQWKSLTDGLLKDEPAAH